MNKGYKVIIVDDNNVFRDGLRFFIETQTNWEIIQEESSGIDFLLSDLKAYPDIVFMDINMPLINGIDTVSRFFTKYSKRNIKVMGITMYANDYHVRHLIEAGFSGCILKKDVYKDLKGAVNTAMDKGVYFHGSINL